MTTRRIIRQTDRIGLQLLRTVNLSSVFVTISWTNPRICAFSKVSLHLRLTFTSLINGIRNTKHLFYLVSAIQCSQLYFIHFCLSLHARFHPLLYFILPLLLHLLLPLLLLFILHFRHQSVFHYASVTRLFFPNVFVSYSCPLPPSLSVCLSHPPSTFQLIFL